MIIRSLLPKLAPKTVKEKIIVILSSEFPLTIKEMKAKIKKSFNQSVSYQSVHKELNRLTKEEITIHKQKKYMLNIDWIRQVGLFSDLIISNYTSQKKHSINKLLELKNDGDSMSFDFESYAQLDRYFFELLTYFNEFFETDKKILMHYYNNWWPLVYPLKEKRVVTKLKSKIYGICGSNNIIDKFCIDYENKIGMNVLQSNDPNLHWNVNIMGDLIFSFYSDPIVEKAIANFFKKHKDLKSLDINELVNIVEMKGKFRVVVLKDAVYAKNALREIELFN